MGQSKKRIQRAGLSDAQILARAANRPHLSYDDALPIAHERQRIQQAIADNQVIIVCGDTGSGKSTQLPKICLEAGRGLTGFIGHTQPRRIAARSVAQRISDEVGVAHPKAVGYRTRFDEKIDSDNYIRLLTDGMLLAELANDHSLSAYDTIIIDEAHERSLNIDFLIGYLKRLLPKRPDLKVIITSATIDPERFSKHFNNAPIIMVEGRTFPVEVRYRPPEDEEEDKLYIATIREAVERRDGDVLVFLPGEAQIKDLEKTLRKHPDIRCDVIPLFGRLSPNDQQRVFSTAGKSGLVRVVLATNVAETSITVPGIRYVIDSGLARVQRFSNTHQVKRLPIEAIAKANADQRKGRCGRVAAGICYRLYSEEDFLGRPQYLEPEILRTSLSHVILTMSYLRLGQPEQFPFIDAPKVSAIREARKLLVELGAFDKRQQLTERGRQLARLPIDPRVGRVLLESRGRQCLLDGLVLTSFLSSQDARIITNENRDIARQKHLELIEEKTSEVWEVVLLWRRLNKERATLSRRAFNRFCEQHHISSRRFAEWGDIYRQLKEVIKAKPQELNETDNPTKLYQALLSGFLGNIAQQYDGREYRGTRNKAIFIAPGRRANDKWIVAAELVHTSRLFARMTAPINPEWIIEQADDGIIRSYSDTHWSKKSANIMAKEKCSYQGLVVRANRSVPYGPINPKESRQVFIQEALVGEALRDTYPFTRPNRDFLAEFEDLEHRARRSDMRLDEMALYDFFNERIPEDCWSESRLSQWLKGQPKDALIFKESDFAFHVDTESIEKAYPAKADIGVNQADIDYSFAPGSDTDGARMEIDIAHINQVDIADIDWAVPGLVEERVLALLRSLPKPKRKLFVPVNQTAERFIQSLNHKPPLIDALVDFLNQERQQAKIVASDFNLSQIDAHLLPLMSIIDDKGRVLDSGRDFIALRAKWGQVASTQFASEGWGVDHKPVNIDDFALEAELFITRSGRNHIGYPALTVRNNQLVIGVFDNAELAKAEHRKGLSFAVVQEVAEIKHVLKNYKRELDTLALAYASISTREELESSVIAMVIDEVFLTNEPLPRTSNAFKQWIKSGMPRLGLSFKNAIEILDKTLKGYQRNSQLIDAFNIKGREETAKDMRRQLDSLVYKGFVRTTPAMMFPHLARYLQALEIRIERANADFQKDRVKMQSVNQFAPVLEDEAINDAFRFALEEFKVLTYAPELGTHMKVSAKILRSLTPKDR